MTSARTVLVVDDDADLLSLLQIRLSRAGFAVQTAGSGEQALTMLGQRRPDVLVSDLKMAGMDGLALLQAVEARYPVLPVILLTAHGTIPDAVTATSKGAFAFLTKPINDGELIRIITKAAGTAGGRATGADNTADSTDSADSSDWKSGIITRSPAMDAVLQEARLAAASDASIIIQSESGTGKELLARAIHAASQRAGQAFVPVNCTAIPEALFESELFGHVRGAFTGAHAARDGLLKHADGGTLFLDEIGDMPLNFQAKLLRVLQEQAVRPVGADRDININVRIISATHRDLEQAVAEDEFRSDLFYRLSVITLELPRLADRREDIPLLAHHFLRQFAGDGIATGFSSEAMERLLAASWRGNVRELANVVQQCKVLSRTELISEALVERALRGKARGLMPFATARDRFELDYLSNLLQVTGGNVSRAARLAERNRSEFYKLLRKHDLEPALFRQDDGVEFTEGTVEGEGGREAENEK